jgi:hypothetical protein
MNDYFCKKSEENYYSDLSWVLSKINNSAEHRIYFSADAYSFGMKKHNSDRKVDVKIFSFENTHVWVAEFSGYDMKNLYSIKEKLAGNKTFCNHVGDFKLENNRIILMLSQCNAKHTASDSADLVIFLLDEIDKILENT